MKKHLLILIFILFCYNLHSQINIAYNNLLSQSKSLSKNQTDLIFEKVKEFPNETQISIGIIKSGIIEFYGIKRKNDSIIKIENHKNVFEVGSITKIFTSTILANFVLDKRLELDDKINPYLNFRFKNDTEISFKQLANHTSGLPRLPTNLDLAAINPENPYQQYDEIKLKEYLTNELKLSKNPGENYQYSNLGVGLLGYILSKVDNTNYESLLQGKIFSKYHMTSSTTYRDKVEQVLIKGLNEKGNEVPNWDLSVLMGAGGVLSTVEDLSKFATAQFDDSNKELALTRTKTFTLNSISDYGLGWEIINLKSGAIWYKHNGGTGGYSSVIIINTAKKNGIIILSNVSSFNRKSSYIDDLSFELMKNIE